MCSVVACDSWRRSTKRFKLPEDPERRLEWVQFLLEVNEQRLYESDWTDITICSEHFTDDCFTNLTQLKSSAVPSLCIKSEPEEPLGSPHVKSVGTTVHQWDDPKTCDSPTSYSELSEHTQTASHSPDVSHAVASGSEPVPRRVTIDLNRERAALLQMKGKVAVNEICLFQLFRHKCPSCGFTLQMEKVTCGLLIILNQRCLQCGYKYQWKSQVNASVPTVEDQQEIPTGDNPGCAVFSDIVTLGDEDCNLSDEGKEGDDGQETLGAAGVSPHADPGTCNSPASVSEKSEHSVPGSQPSPESSAVSRSPDVSHDVASGSDMVLQKVPVDMNMERAALLRMKGKFAVNEGCLFQLFQRKCPSCGFKLQMEKVTCGLLIVLNLRCFKCDYKFQWKSQVNATVPAMDDQQEMPPDDDPGGAILSEIVTFSDEDSVHSDEGEEGDDGQPSSDGEWCPLEGILPDEDLIKDSEEETEDDSEEEEEEFESPGGLKINELCTECGCFFNILKPHTCEYKIKPFSCNICGKRCVTESSLKAHSRIHDETYEHPCKYCYITFKTRVDKCKHEEIHQGCKDPYRCPDCPETFATRKKRNIHLTKHRAPKEYKCGVCGIAFKDVHHLRRHSVVHTGLKPYKCSVCQRGFNQGSHLKSHMRLHTGERPYKCKYCDRKFNHNVSLKSHIQRYHSSGSGGKRKKEKVTERLSDSGEAEDDGNKKGTDSEFDNIEEEQDTEEQVETEQTVKPKTKSRCTGRPRGRPKRNTAGDLVQPKEKTVKSKRQRRRGSSDEESEDDQSESDVSSDLKEEEEMETETARKGAAGLRRRPKNDSESDSDFDPDEVSKKKRYSSQSAGKRRGRPKKNVED